MLGVSAECCLFCLIDGCHCLFFTLGYGFPDVSLDLCACRFRDPGSPEFVIFLVIDNIPGTKGLIQNSIHGIFPDKTCFSQAGIYKNFRCDRSARNKLCDLIADDPHIFLYLIEFLEVAVQFEHDKHADYKIRKVSGNECQYGQYSDCVRQEAHGCSVNERVSKFHEKYNSNSPEQRKFQTYIPAEVIFFVAVIPPSGME